MRYYREKLGLLIRDLDDYRYEELERDLQRLAESALNEKSGD